MSEDSKAKRRQAYQQAFDKRVELMGQSGPAGIQGAFITVCDTAETCRVWFESQGIVPTGADLVALTNLVLQERYEATKRR